MEKTDKELLRQTEEKIRQQHPNWSAEKTRWVALQNTGMIPTRR